MDRLRTKKEFDMVYKSGFRRHSKSFVLYVCKDKILDPKIGFSVSKKVGNAVKRNLIKRRVKSLFREIKGLIIGLKILFVAKNEILFLSFADLKKSLLECLNFILSKFRMQK